MNVNVIVDVVAPVIVAVHANGNDTVIVIRPGDATHATADQLLVLHHVEMHCRLHR